MFVICAPSQPGTSGGVRKLYDLNDILNNAGLAARIVVAPRAVACMPDDILVMPEVYGDELRTTMPGVRKISFNQNFHYTWIRTSEPHPYIDNPDLLAVFTVSEHNERALKWCFPNANVQRWYTSVGRPQDFYCGSFPRERRICYFGRKKGDRAELVLHMLRTRGNVSGWEVLNMDGMTDTDVGATMRSSAIFLSFSELEGFGSPPLEAMACGCLVIGFAGAGGREYFDTHHTLEVDDDEILGFAASVEYAIRQGKPLHEDKRRRASAWALAHYSREREVSTLVELFKALL